MQTDRIFREAGHDSAPSIEAGAPTPHARDYRQEVADCDDQLVRDLDHLAALYRASDIVNCGAQ
jgi:hypothetical protein